MKFKIGLFFFITFLIGACFPMFNAITNIPIMWPSIVGLSLFLFLRNREIFQSASFVWLLVTLIWIITANYKNENFVLFEVTINFFIPVYATVLFVEYFKAIQDKNSFKLVVVIGMVFILIRSITGIIVEIIEPGAARVLTGNLGEGWKASKSQQLFQKYGIALYTFISALPFMQIPILYTLNKSKIRKIRALMALLIFTNISVIIYTGWGTALIFVIIVIFIYFIFSRIENIFLASLIALIFFMLFNYYSYDILELTKPVLSGNETLFNKISDIQESLKTGSTFGQVEDRGDLYNISINSFFYSPIWGDVESDVGGHAFWFDWLARYGILGIVPIIVCFINIFKSTIKFLPKKYGIISTVNFVLFMMYGFVKNIGGFDFFVLPFVIGPLSVFYFNESYEYIYTSRKKSVLYQ